MEILLILIVGTFASVIISIGKNLASESGEDHRLSKRAIHIYSMVVCIIIAGTIEIMRPEFDWEIFFRNALLTLGSAEAIYRFVFKEIKIGGATLNDYLEDNI